MLVNYRAPVQTPAIGDGSAVTDAGAGQTSATTPSTTAAPPPADQAAALAALDSAASELDTAKASGDLGQIGAASQKLEDAVNAYLTLAGTALPSASLAPVSTPGG